MDDVVEQGGRDQWGPPRWLRGTALVLAVGLGALVVTRPHLLSAGEPAPDRPTPRAAASGRSKVPARARGVSPRAVSKLPAAPLELGPNTSQGISLVVRQGDHLERYEAGTGRWPLGSLPTGLRAPAPLAPARD